MTVELFVSCIIDQMYPLTAMNVVKILKSLDIDIEYNPEQTCCGKFAYNSGYVEEAKKLGNKLLNDISSGHTIIGINASCVGFIKTRYKDLFYNTASHLEYKRFVNNIYEFTDFLINVLGKDYFGAVFPHKAVYMQSCSSSSELGLKDEGRRLLSKVNGLELLELKKPEVCCGFGSGLFSVQHEAISSSLADQKFNDAIDAGAEYIITNDMSCLLHLDSYAKKQNIPVKTIHIADVLSSGWELDNLA